MVAQSIEAVSARAVALALAGKPGDARDAAEEASRLTERVHYPAGRASALEATGVAGADAKALEEARAAWEELGRPLDAMRCQKLLEELELQPPGGAAT
jgi:hypothetical protein